MNREILFRGKRAYNNKWVYGDLIQDFSYEKHNYYIGDNDCNEVGDVFYQENEVIPETIGQYTGLKDKNGKDVYEGDKVKAKFYGKEVVGEIGFNSGCFLLWNSCVSDNQLFIFTDIEVIGNIYENEVD